jgi:hypothetical protein
MIELETELQALTPEDGYRLYAQRLQVWRLCGRAACRRARGCDDPPSCCRRFAAWAEAPGNASATPTTPRPRPCARSFPAGSAAWPRRCGTSRETGALLTIVTLGSGTSWPWL